MESAYQLLLLGDSDAYFPGQDIYQALEQRLAQHLNPVPIQLACAQLSQMLDKILPETDKVFILPVYMALSARMGLEITAQVAELKAFFPNTQFVLLPPVAEFPGVMDKISQSIAEQILARA